MLTEFPPKNTEKHLSHRASYTDALWWEYSTTQAAGDNMRVTASARNLPGHVTERTKVKGHPLMA